MRKLVIAAAALGFTGTAYAADMPLLKAPPVMAAPSWTGFYIGVNGGGAWGRADTGLDIQQPDSYFTALGLIGSTAITNNRVAVQDAGANNISYSGGLAGGQVGYLLQQGSVIAGLEAAFDWSGAKSSTIVNGVYPGGAGAVTAAGNPFNFNERVSSSWLFTLLGRVGFDMGAWYPYATVGLALSDLKYSNVFTDLLPPTGPGGSAVSLNQIKPGIAGGAGLEWRWDSHWSLRGEYLYISFADVSGFSGVCTTTGAPANCAPGAPTTIFHHNADFAENVARAYLSYKW